MSVSKSQIVRPFTFPGLFGRQVRCDLSIVELTDGRNVCIASERNDNTGASITNVAELVATWAAYEFKLAAETVVWIEHYPARVYPGDRVSGERWNRDQWDRVEFTVVDNRGGGFPAQSWCFAQPSWRPMLEEDWREVGFIPEGAVRHA